MSQTREFVLGGGSVDRVLLRPETDADEPFLFTLYQSAREAEMALVDWDPDTKLAFLRMQFSAQRSHYLGNYHNAEFSIIEVGGERAGRFYLARWDEEIRIIDIVLLPEFRRRGIGSRLIEQVQVDGRTSRRSVSIHVERFNPALQLYERLGFVPVEDKGVYLLLRWEPPSPEE